MQLPYGPPSRQYDVANSVAYLYIGCVNSDCLPHTAEMVVVDTMAVAHNYCYELSIAGYLELGMRYEAGICTIVISMNGAFQCCPFCCRLNFDPKPSKTMDYSLWSTANFDKNVAETKNHFKDII